MNLWGDVYGVRVDGCMVHLAVTGTLTRASVREMERMALMYRTLGGPPVMAVIPQRRRSIIRLAERVGFRRSRYVEAGNVTLCFP